MIARRPFGGGLESFSREFPLVQSAQLARAYPDFYHESAHNLMLDLGAAAGVPGLLAMVLLLGSGLRQGWRARAAAPGNALAASLVAVVAAQQFSSLVAPTALMLFVHLAFLAALDPAAKAVPAGGSRRLRFGAAVPVACVLTVFGVRLVAADRMLARSKDEIERGRFESAALSYQRALDWQPPGMAADLWYSRSMANAAQGTADARLKLLCWRQAMHAAQRATRSSEDRHNAWYSMAALAAQENDYAAVEHSLRQAIAASPHWYKPHWMLAEVLHAAGRLDEAAREAAIAVDRNGGRNTEVTRTEAQIQSALASRSGGSK
jgi:tetratricopeptide (TPR) repeat protein